MAGYKPYRPKKKRPRPDAAPKEERTVAKTIQWFPGHMTKAKREIEENLKAVDIAIELCDARIPDASRNPMIRELLGDKPSLVLMNKCSLADPIATAAWKAYFQKTGQTVLFTDCITGEGVADIVPTVREILKDKIARWEAKGMVGKLPRAMILGITNAGKSTLINTLCKSAKLKTEDRPGVTRAQQWVTLKGGLELLDTPGILWPKFKDEKTALKLAYIGAIRDEITDKEEIAVRLCGTLASRYPKAMQERYKLDDEYMDLDAYDLFEVIGAKRGFRMSGGAIDTLRTATMLCDEFRGGRIGRLSLELPPKETPVSAKGEGKT